MSLTYDVLKDDVRAGRPIDFGFVTYVPERTCRMPTDDERREVARRLREIRPCTIGYIKWWKIAQALGLKEPAGWLGWEKFEPDSVQRLADFIDPDYGTQEADISSVHEHSADTSKMVDRESLLALADEMDDCGLDGWACGPVDVGGFARRIREACGVDDAD